MKRKTTSRQTRLKTKLGLPDLEHVKVAVIASLRSFESQRSYRHSIDEFVAWYCSAPRLSFSKAVVLRYRLHLEDRHLAAGTINVRLAAVRRLAYEAADSGLLSPDLAAGIRRVKGAKKLGCGYLYDANGNMTNDGSNTLVHDAENRTLSATNGSTSGTYTYDARNLRVKKLSGTTTAVYVFSGSKVVAEYVNGAAPTSPTREYIYSGSALVAKIEAGATKYYHQDHLSNRLVTDSSGNVTAQVGHYPFGESWYNATNDKLLFTTYERDAESGNDFATSRYYINRLGRFSSPDPLIGSIDDPQSLNRFPYTENNPINASDPSGAVTTMCNERSEEACPFRMSGGFEFGSTWDEFDIVEKAFTPTLDCSRNSDYCGANGLETTYGNWGLLSLLAGGGTSGVSLEVGNLVNEAIATALKALKSKKCCDLFGNDFDPSALLENLAAGTGDVGNIHVGDIGGVNHGNINAAATTGILSSGPVSSFSGADITINSNPLAPFTAGYPALAVLGRGNAIGRAVTIIHELGHAANRIYGSTSSAIVEDDVPGVSRLNTIVVIDDCF